MTKFQVRFFTHRAIFFSNNVIYCAFRKYRATAEEFKIQNSKFKIIIMSYLDDGVSYDTFTIYFDTINITSYPGGCLATLL